LLQGDTIIYIKSVLAGLLAVIAAPIALPILCIIGTIVYGVIHPPPEGTAVGWAPISLAKQPLPIVALIVVIFAAGFVWEFRRLAR